MKTEWRTQHAVVIFYPANNELTRYYADAGAVLDGANHRMRFDFKHLPNELTPEQWRPSSGGRAGREGAI